MKECHGGGTKYEKVEKRHVVVAKKKTCTATANKNVQYPERKKMCLPCSVSGKLFECLHALASQQGPTQCFRFKCVQMCNQGTWKTSSISFDVLQSFDKD